MNKLLAEVYSVLNGFFALLTIVLCGVAGKYLGPTIMDLYAQSYRVTYMGSPVQAETIGIICGLALGFLFAVVFGGLIALFIQMHRELKAIRQQLTDSKPLRAPTSHSQLTIAELVGRRL